jgi:hypothetical protein
MRFSLARAQKSPFAWISRNGAIRHLPERARHRARQSIPAPGGLSHLLIDQFAPNRTKTGVPEDEASGCRYMFSVLLVPWIIGKAGFKCLPEKSLASF